MVGCESVGTGRLQLCIHTYDTVHTYTCTHPQMGHIDTLWPTHPHMQYGLYAREVGVAPQVLGGHHVVRPAVGLARDDRHLYWGEDWEEVSVWRKCCDIEWQWGGVVVGSA